jgi:hypothetical protein
LFVTAIRGEGIADADLAGSRRDPVLEILALNIRSRIVNRRALKRLAILAVLIAIFLTWAYFSMIRMPGRSFSGDPPPLTPAQSALADELQRDVEMLAGTIGKRNVYYSTGLNQAVAFLEQSLRDAGYADVRRQAFRSLGMDVHNLEVEIRGSSRPEEIVVVGAHYDSVDDSPAANDNGSGVAATLALARRFANIGGPGVSPGRVANTEDAADEVEAVATTDARPGETPGPPIVAPPARTLRFVLFVNEEPPHFQTDEMGSLVYARACRERNENIVAMLSLETIGCYSDAPGSQVYPVRSIGWLYPSVGNFIAFVGDYRSRHLVRQAIGTFRANAQFPSEGAALPGWITGVGWSDHWAFWQCGYPAMMVTDTALFRYPHYHQRSDTPDKLDYPRTARVVEGMETVVRELVK